MCPSANTTRWHGTMPGRGFACSAYPTWRAQRGAPMSAATWPYVATHPRGICSTTSYTRSKKPSFLRGPSFVAGCASMAARFNRRWVRAFYTASDLPIVPRAHDIARSQLPRMGTDRLKGAAISSQLMKRARGMSIMGMSFGSQGEPLLGEVVYVGNTHSEHPRSGLAISGGGLSS